MKIKKVYQGISMTQYNYLHQCHIHMSLNNTITYEGGNISASIPLSKVPFFVEDSGNQFQK